MLSEIITIAGSDLRITANPDGTYTARVGCKETICKDFHSAVMWAHGLRDGKDYGCF